jgi:hypothetical protein
MEQTAYTAEPPPSLYRGYAGPSHLYDEMCDAGGALRPSYHMFVTLLDDLGPKEISRRWEQARLIVHWKHGARGLTTAALLAVGAGPDPITVVRERGWEHLMLEAAIGVNRRLEAVPPFAADLVTARAVAPLDSLLGLAEPFSRPTTISLFHKGNRVGEELKDYAPLMLRLGLAVIFIIHGAEAVPEVRSPSAMFRGSRRRRRPWRHARTSATGSAISWAAGSRQGPANGRTSRPKERPQRSG